jgi:hypothetical protein
MDEPVWRCFLQDFLQIDNDREARRVKYRPDMIGTTSQIDLLEDFQVPCRAVQADAIR